MSVVGEVAGAARPGDLGALRVSVAGTNALIRLLVGWLEVPDPAAVHRLVGRWSPATWQAWRLVVTTQGLAPHLFRSLPGTLLDDVLPPRAREWLAEQDALNARRIARMHAELAAILAAAAGAGMPVMPLKGALLTTMPGTDPYRRPMADLDLLVRPADRNGLRAIVERLGYRHEPEKAPRPTHDVYVDPGGGRIVSGAGEHPDNPRRVEVHIEVKRHLWAWSTGDDLTGALWAGAAEGEVLGYPAMVPAMPDLLAHLAVHASSDLLVGRGRLIQWADLALVAPRVAPEVLRNLPHPPLAYPALRLATRAFPRAMASVELAGLAARLPGRLVRWTQTVPLDGRSGLQVGSGVVRPASLRARWQRWFPRRWRLWVAYGDLPLPVALARHGLTMGSALWPRVRPKRIAADGENLP
jgi:hypothetical protein